MELAELIKNGPELAKMELISKVDDLLAQMTHGQREEFPEVHGLLQRLSVLLLAINSSRIEWLDPRWEESLVVLDGLKVYLAEMAAEDIDG